MQRAMTIYTSRLKKGCRRGGIMVYNGDIKGCAWREKT